MEKAFARLLYKSQTPYFLPVYTQTWRKSGRQFRSILPLFSNYVFVSGEPQVRDVAFATNLVVRDVPANDQSQLASELASLNRLLGGGESLRPEEGLSKGARVLVVKGIYAGVEGRVLEAGSELRVCVEISLLGRGVSVLVERWMLKSLDNAT
jgi:transcriptional antiterminator RfaH